MTLHSILVVNYNQKVIGRPYAIASIGYIIYKTFSLFTQLPGGLFRPRYKLKKLSHPTLLPYLIEKVRYSSNIKHKSVGKMAGQ